MSFIIVHYLTAIFSKDSYTTHFVTFSVLRLFQLLNGVLLTQTQITAGGGGGDVEEATIELANDILRKLPETFDVDEVSEKYPVIYTNSMNTVLRQVRSYAETPQNIAKKLFIIDINYRVQLILQWVITYENVHSVRM